MNSSSKGDCFVTISTIHYAAKPTTHTTGYRLECKTLAVRVGGWSFSGFGIGPGEGLYTFDKQQPPRLPVHSGDYAQPSSKCFN
jgi:hypothetical protein